jgi:molybdate transport system substrate-binding protein
VKAVVSKIVLGEGDVGFVYRTDVKPAANDVNFYRLPTWAQPPVRYQICVVKDSDHKAAVRAFVKRVLGPIGRGNLSGALFTLPPKR